ncbi:MAG: hypothetical protein LBU79_04630, partial [Planctomycetota bacterium]|nr:hypothetical protein [Planctomycetota bacterium]
GGIVNLPGLEILPLAQAVPSPPFFSYGQLNPEELTAAREVWRAPPGPDSVRLVCGHYPLTGTGRLSWLFSGLRGGQSLRDFLETSRVAGYLCGHIHHSQSLDLGQGVWQHVAPALPLRGVVRRYHCGDGKLTPIA